MFKKLLFVSLLALFSQSSHAANWDDNFAHAATNAAKTGRFMLLNFTGSDWCGWCKKLQKEVFTQHKFKTFADANLVCVEVDFPHKKPQSQTLKEQNKRLAKEYGIRGYPSIVILSPKGDAVAKTGYRPGGAQTYVTHLQEIIDLYKKQSAEKPGKAVTDKKE